MIKLAILATLATGTLCAESLEQWVCDKISDFNVPDPKEGYFIDEGDYYSYYLGYKHAYQEMLEKVRKHDIEELEMAD